MLQAGEIFSQNEIAGPYTEEKGYLEGEVYVGGAVIRIFNLKTTRMIRCLSGRSL